jgi:hypothetical protein
MADRTSAHVAGEIFDLLAENPTEEIMRLARKIYDIFTSNCDFSDEQMGATEACLALGIARLGIRPEYPEDGEVALWPGEDGYDI